MESRIIQGLKNFGFGSLLLGIGLTILEIPLIVIPFGSLIGIALGLVGLVFVIIGFKGLRASGVQVSTSGPYTLIIGGTMFLAGSVALSLFASNLVGFISNVTKISVQEADELLLISLVVLISLTILLVGGIVTGISVYNLGKLYGDSVLQVAGILIAIPFLEFIGFFLAWIGGSQVQKHPNPVASYQYQYQALRGNQYSAPSLYQVGLGTINSAGTAFFSIYSPGQFQITRAQLLDSNIVISESGAITPSFLVVGNNNVVVNFVQIQANPGRTYIVRLFFPGFFIDAIVKYTG